MELCTVVATKITRERTYLQAYKAWNGRRSRREPLLALCWQGISGYSKGLPGCGPIYPSINPASAASIMMDASEFDSYSKINLVRFLLGHSTIFARAIRILGFVENLRRIDRIPDSPW